MSEEAELYRLESGIPFDGEAARPSAAVRAPSLEASEDAEVGYVELFGDDSEEEVELQCDSDEADGEATAAVQPSYPGAKQMYQKMAAQAGIVRPATKPQSAPPPTASSSKAPVAQSAPRQTCWPSRSAPQPSRSLSAAQAAAAAVGGSGGSGSANRAAHAFGTSRTDERRPTATIERFSEIALSSRMLSTSALEEILEQSHCRVLKLESANAHAGGDGAWATIGVVGRYTTAMTKGRERMRFHKWVLTNLDARRPSTLTVVLFGDAAVDEIRVGEVRNT